MSENVDTTTQSMADIAATIEIPSGAAESSTTPNDASSGASDNVAEFKDFVANSQKDIESVRSELEAVKSEHADFVKSRQLEQLNKDISSAVDKINDEVGGDSEMAEIFLEKQYDDAIF